MWPKLTSKQVQHPENECFVCGNRNDLGESNVGLPICAACEAAQEDMNLEEDEWSP